MSLLQTIIQRLANVEGSDAVCVARPAAVRGFLW